VNRELLETVVLVCAALGLGMLFGAATVLLR
jgi:hypothetical protein